MGDRIAGKTVPYYEKGTTSPACTSTTVRRRPLNYSTFFHRLLIGFRILFVASFYDVLVRNGKQFTMVVRWGGESRGQLLITLWILA